MRYWTSLLVVGGLFGGVSLSPLTVKASTFDLTLLHINDMHARYEQTSKLSGTCSTSDQNKNRCYGGVSRVANIIKTERAVSAQNTLVLNAGDIFQGTVYYSIFKWNISAHFMNWLEFDAITLGNHEFDDHVEGLVPYVEALKYPLVVANANFSEEPTLAALNITKSIVVTRNGVEIGIIGYITPETTTLSSTDGVTFIDEVTALTAEAARLKSAGVNIIIGLGHSGYQMDQVIAAQVPDIDLVVGGHSHSFLYTGNWTGTEVPVGLYPTIVTQPTTNRKVPVVQAYAFTKYMGKLKLTFDADGELLNVTGEPILLNSEIDQDPETLAEVEKWKSELDTRVLLPVGTTEVLLDATRCRQVECNIGNLVADSFVFYRASQYRGSDAWTDAPIALVNGGSIRTSIDARSVNGTITIKDIMEVLPFDNLDVVLKVRGSVLREALEHSVSEYVTGQAWRGSFLQLAGVRVTYDVDQPSGSRVSSATVRCGNCTIPQYGALDDSTLYSIIVNGFLANGGDGYSMLANNEGSETLGETDAMIMQSYISKQSPVYPGIEGRITFISETTSTASSLVTDSSTVTQSVTATGSTDSPTTASTKGAGARSAAPLGYLLAASYALQRLLSQT